MTLSDNASRHGYRFARKCLGFLEMIYVFQVRRVVEGCYKRHPMFPALELQPSRVYILSQAHSLFKPFKHSIHTRKIAHVFNDMRRRGALYAYRTLSRECPLFFEPSSRLHRERDALVYGKRLPRGALLQFHGLAFYNNWHVTKTVVARTGPRALRRGLR